jgi:diguanylate cyclase (GGDEF)-like protein
MMISERRPSQFGEDAGWDRSEPAGSAAPLLQAAPRRAPRSLRSVIAGVANRLSLHRRDVSWVGESMLRTTAGLAVYVFRGEATIGYDLVVTHRGPGRDRLLGGTPTGVSRIDWADAVHPEDRALQRAAESYVQLSKGRPISASFRMVGMDGVTRWVSEHLAPRWEHGRLLVDGVVIDVTSQRVARTDAEQAQRRLEAVMRSANTYVWVAEVGADGVMTSVYTVAGIERTMGRGPAVVGTPGPRWRSVVHPDDLERFDAVIVAAGHGHSFDIEYRLNGLDGITRIVRDQAVATLLGDGRYRLDGMVQEVTAEHDARRALGAALATAEDRAEEVEELLAETSSLHALAEAARRAAEDHARRLAAAHAELERIGRLDSLTGLTNRRYATRVMDEALARRDPVGIAMLDVDGFKRVNDTHGHAGGDAVLIEIARRLAATRAEDLVARWGGEEFCVLLTGIDDDESLYAASERLREAVGSEPVLLDDGSVIHITVSIGAGRPKCPSERLERLVIAADDALYEAKRGGRNRVCLVPELPVVSEVRRIA